MLILSPECQFKRHEECRVAWFGADGRKYECLCDCRHVHALDRKNKVACISCRQPGSHCHLDEQACDGACANCAMPPQNPEDDIEDGP